MSWRDRFVGWVERSETHLFRPELAGWVSLRSTHPTIASKIRPAIPEPFKCSASFDVVDVTGRQADIPQLALAQVVQTDPRPLALTPIPKRAPICLEEAQDTPRRCDGWSSRSARELRWLGWHRMLLLLCRQGAWWPNKRPRPMPAGPGEKIASSNS